MIVTLRTGIAAWLHEKQQAQAADLRTFQQDISP
jgi:hypothetical protein